MQEPIEHESSAKKAEEDEKQETISDIRVHPDHVLSAVAEKEEFLQPGEWIYSFEDALYQDVLRSAFLEGYRVTQIEQKGDEIHIKIKEDEPVYED